MIGLKQTLILLKKTLRVSQSNEWATQHKFWIHNNPGTPIDLLMPHMETIFCNEHPTVG